MSAQNEAPSELRKMHRVDIPGIIRVTDLHTNRRLGQLVNISEEGLMLLAQEPVAEHAVFQLSLDFRPPSGDSKPLCIGVECLWCNKGNNDDQFWAGFYIIDISESDQERIRRMLG